MPKRSTLDDLEVPPTKKAKRNLTDEEKQAEIQKLSKLKIPELKLICKGKGLRFSGTKDALIQRIIDPTTEMVTNKAKKPRTTNPKSLKTVQRHLIDIGYGEGGSYCAMAAIARGHLGSILLKADLDRPQTELIEKVKSSTEYNYEDQVCCGDIKITIRTLLDQPDHGGGYEDGIGGGVHCICGKDSGIYITSMCTGQMILDSGKFHNHCTQCKSFGKCMGDYRMDHCSNCGKHYFAGLSGQPCSCEESNDF